MDRSEKWATNTLLGRAYAQQGLIEWIIPGLWCLFPSCLDAEECYSTILNTLRNIPGLDNTGNVASGTGVANRPRFVDQYLMGEMHREYGNRFATCIISWANSYRLRCDEAPEEPPVVSTEKILKIECNITSTTNFMLTGIVNVCHHSYQPIQFLIPFFFSRLTRRSRRTRPHWDDRRCIARNRVYPDYRHTLPYTWFDLPGEPISEKRQKSW